MLLSTILETGCADNDSKRIEELERQVEALTKQLEQQQSDKALPFQVFEKDVEAVHQVVNPNPNIKEEQALTFRLLVGDRVEGNVTITGGRSDTLIAAVIDPYNNRLFQSATKEEHIHVHEQGTMITRHLLANVQEYPWKFGFIAASTGDYTLAVWATGGTVSAKLKVTIYR